jgi:hypothetical protein
MKTKQKEFKMNNKTLDNLTVLATGMISLKITFLNIFPFNSLYSLYIIDKKKRFKVNCLYKTKIWVHIIMILRQKIIFFSILGGARAGCTPPGSALVTNL